MRSAVTFFLFAALTVVGFCSTIPSDITKTVVFIYKDANGKPGLADGTGFLIEVPTPVDPHRFWLYLVTAKHVIHTDMNSFDSPICRALWVRVNKKGGGFEMFRLGLGDPGPEQTFYVSSDPSVDIAVIPIQLPDSNNLDVEILPEDMLASSDDITKLNIGIGSDMFFTGMFTPFLGEQKSYPIVRFGKLAMMPDEKVPFNGVPTEGYLMEAFSFGGNSGSPVFFHLSSDNTPGQLMVGPAVTKIAGVMKGFFGDIEPIGLATPLTAQPSPSVPVSKGNSGIAMVVPAKFIKEILHSPDLEKIRSKEMASWGK